MNSVSEGKRLAAIGAISNLVGFILSKSIGIILAIILTRSLTVADFGIFNLFLATMTLLGGVSLGFDKIIQRYFPLLLKTDSSQAISLYVVFLIKRYLVMIALVVLGYTANRIGIIHLKQFDFAHFGIAVCAGAILTGRLCTANALNAAYLDHRYLNFVLVLADFAKLAGLVLVWEGGVAGVLVIWTTAEACALILLLGRLVLRVRPRELRAFAVNTIRRLDYKRYYHYGKYLAFASASTYVLSTEVDYLFLSYFGNNEYVGLYAFSAKLPFILLMLAPSNLIFNVTLPLLMRKIDDGVHIREINFSILAFLKLNIFAWTIMSALIAFNIEPIIVYVFDVKYLQAKAYVFVWLVVLYALVIKNVFEPVARALEYTRVYLVTFLAAVVNIIGNYISIPVFGIKGALLATGLSFTLQGYVSAYFIMRKMGMEPNVWKISSVLLRVTVLAAVVWQFNVPYDELIFMQLLRNALLVAVFCILFWPGSFFSADEWRYMRAFVPRLS